MSNHSYLSKNKTSWNLRTEEHITSNFYDVESFLKGKSSLNEIELLLLGNIEGKSILHLQCHFGMDSLSLARMGANVTGVDFSDNAINEAKELNRQLNLNAEFICCDIYDLPNYLNKKFDIVYTSYGVIGWLPDLNNWGNVISQFLKKNGKLVFVEFHPMMWIFDREYTEIVYKYSSQKPIIENEGTYTDTLNEIESETVTWNHGLAEPINALIKNEINIIDFQEYDYSPYNISSEMYEYEPNRYQVKKYADMLPLIYSLVGVKL